MFEFFFLMRRFFFYFTVLQVGEGANRIDELSGSRRTRSSRASLHEIDSELHEIDDSGMSLKGIHSNVDAADINPPNSSPFKSRRPPPIITSRGSLSSGPQTSLGRLFGMVGDAEGESVSAQHRRSSEISDQIIARKGMHLLPPRSYSLHGGNPGTPPAEEVVKETKHAALVSEAVLILQLALKMMYERKYIQLRTEKTLEKLKDTFNYVKSFETTAESEIAKSKAEWNKAVKAANFLTEL